MKKVDFKGTVLPVLLLLPCLAVVIIFSWDGLIPIADPLTARLVSESVPRFAAGGYLITLFLLTGYGASFIPSRNPLLLLWSLPCFAVAIVNFPFSALITGKAFLSRLDLLWLFLLKCLSVAFVEEILFRGFIVPALAGENGDRKWLAVLGSAALFALVHLLNLFTGAVGAVLLQVGYTFLLGCMFAVMMLKTKNVWLCLAVHFLFDVGGSLVSDLGGGTVHDTLFWILTGVVGALTAVYLFISFLRLFKKSSHQCSQNE